MELVGLRVPSICSSLVSWYELSLWGCSEASLGSDIEGHFPRSNEGDQTNGLRLLTVSWFWPNLPRQIEGQLIAQVVQVPLGYINRPTKYGRSTTLTMIHQQITTSAPSTTTVHKPTTMSGPSTTITMVQ